jgi:hypothetical protein
MGLDYHVLLEEKGTKIPFSERNPTQALAVPLQDYFGGECDLTRIVGLCYCDRDSLKVRPITEFTQCGLVHERYFNFVYLEKNIIPHYAIPQFYGSILPPNFITGVVVTLEPFDYEYCRGLQKEYTQAKLANLAHKFNGYYFRIIDGKTKIQLPQHTLQRRSNPIQLSNELRN